MSGQEINPTFAAEIASNVYLIKNSDTRLGFQLKYKNIFNLEEGSLAKGKTGGYVLNSRHVMALMCVGKGDYEGAAFVAIKGTASLYDALTDLNTGLRTSHTGFQVHQGFYYAFDSILTDLKNFVGKINAINTSTGKSKPVSVIHVVGHSLGGAVATLAADWLKVNSGVQAIKLYTFGCPRVGFEQYASKCTSNLKPENIYRVYHKTDPVPMLPTWPFFDVPYNSPGYLLYSPASAKVWKYHLMEHYINSVKKKGWNGLALSRPQSYMDYTIEKWLKSDGIVSITAASLEMLNAALFYVIKKVVNLAGIALVSAAAGTFTLLDRMAILLAREAQLSPDLSMWVTYLVSKMASLIGIKIKEGTNLTVELIRMVFMRVHQKISDMIWHIGQEIG